MPLVVVPVELPLLEPEPDVELGVGPLEAEVALEVEEVEPDVVPVVELEPEVEVLALEGPLLVLPAGSAIVPEVEQAS